ncbi:hypothetical protein R6Q59_037086 [Mikania micrantha]
MPHFIPAVHRRSSSQSSDQPPSPSPATATVYCGFVGEFGLGYELTSSVLKILRQ